MDARTYHPRAGLVAQKKTLSASERDEWARAAFRVRIADQAAADFVVVDETGLNLDLTSRYGRAPLGQRAIEKVPRNTPVNTTLIGSCSLGGMGPSMLVVGGVDAATFEVYLEQVLGPSLRPGQIVLVDWTCSQDVSAFWEVILSDLKRRKSASERQIAPITAQFSKSRIVHCDALNGHLAVMEVFLPRNRTRLVSRSKWTT